jgi:Ala-tRNA(Pro) deacylase
MRGDKKIYDQLKKLNINFEYFEHEAIPTIEMALIHKKGIDATHCKNIFLRNHKGKKHYFVVIEQSKAVNIRQLELLLKEGKLSFASDKRLDKYLGVKAGAVSPLGLVHDSEQNTKVFIDKELQLADKLSFHPNVSDASLVISSQSLLQYLEALGIQFEFIKLDNVED